MFTASRKGSPSGKVFVLSLDGVSCHFLRKHSADGLLPNLGRLVEEGDLRELTTVRPAVSLVAWTSYMTGLHPGRHGVFGFLDRRPGSCDLFVPNSKNITASTLWEVISRTGRRVVVINVPVTYPARPVNGVIVSCFLSPSLEEAVYPPERARFLSEMHYRIDTDTRLCKTDREAFLGDLDITLQKRFEAAMAFMGKESWDFFQLHVMETDRINHLLWGDYEGTGSSYREAFLSFYRRLDDLVGELIARLPKECDFLLLSDHGFAPLKKEVYLNRFFEERDWLGFAHRKPRRLADMEPDSLAYSLLPGRVYMNLRGREPQGCVQGRDQYRGVREGLAADLMNLKDPETGEAVAAQVLRGEEVHGNPEWGEFPLPVSEKVPAPCDLLVVPNDGYDLRGSLEKPAVFGRDFRTGMHSAAGAFVFVRGRSIRAEHPHIVDLFPTVLDMMGLPYAGDRDGRSLLKSPAEEKSSGGVAGDE
jgi:predicted AlkP superfamily phosphohydrolase/phosphomutase